MKQEYGKEMRKPNITISGDSDRAVEVFVVGELEFDTDFKKQVLSSMQKIGYDLTDIDAQQGLYATSTTDVNEYKLIVVEKHKNIHVRQIDMSQGMFRALSLIIHITYNTLMGLPITILIDDIGEGLDFERSSSLIKLLMEMAKTNDIQLIMSTNDRFVMNNVPLEYWQLIQRDGGECKIFNYKNSKEIFDDFEYTGLSNFDFLSTDFINNQESVEI
jgi:hypothetical protein